MKKLILIILILISNLGFSQTASSVITKDSINLSLLSTLILEKINIERSKLNLQTLTVDLDAQNFAKKHSQWMANTSIFEHSNVYTTLTYSECIYKCCFGLLIDYSITYDRLAQTIVEGWMTSTKGHREILLDATGTKAGIYSASLYDDTGIMPEYIVYSTFEIY